MSAAKSFNDHFGAQPTWKQFVPGRVNLIGEHTDYNGGLVLPTVLDRGITITASPNDLGVDQLISELKDGLVQREPNFAKSGQWFDYLGGMADAMRQQFGADQCFSFLISSNLPDGAGVSSSAALMVAVGKAIRGLFEAEGQLDDEEIALMAQRVENEFIGVPCGIMDQMAVSLGEAGKALMLDTHTMAHETVPLLPDYSFAVVDSGIRRELLDGRYAARRKECDEAAQRLGVTDLCRDLSMDQLSALSDYPNLHGRAKHVVSDHHRVSQMATALRQHNAKECGELLNEGHRSLSEDFVVSTPEIDALCDTAVMRGALGARMTGGGFGGCIVALVKADQVADWFRAVQAEFPKTRLIHPW